MPQLSRITKIKKEVRHYRFPGEEVGDRLVFWLNGPPENTGWKAWGREMLDRFGGGISGDPKLDGRARARVIQVIEDLQELARVFQLVSAGRGRPTPSDLMRLRAAEEQVNRHLRRYISAPHVCANEPYWKEGRWLLVYGDQASPFVWTRTLRSVLLQEETAIWAIERLSRLGRLERLRRCDLCKKFFYARKSFSLYCGAECRGWRYRSPHYKRWREQYKNS